MGVRKQLANYSCQPMSRGELRAYAQSIRRAFRLENCIYFPVERFLEILPIAIGDEEFYFHVIPDLEWELPDSVHAYYDVEDNCIYIKESVYIGASNGVGRDRMTIIHECAHVLLIKHSHIQLHRNFGGAVRPYEDPEWQAKCLAGELMVPKELVRGLNAEEVSQRCGVSVGAARYQLSKY